jgi:tetratricopeptide (TPR) repeat protein
VALVAILGGASFLWERYAHPPGLQEASAADLRGTELLTRGQYDEAIAEFDQALAINPLGESYYNRGLAYFFKKDLDKAIADWNNAIRLNVSDGRAYRQRAKRILCEGRLQPGDRRLQPRDRNRQERREGVLQPRAGAAVSRRGCKSGERFQSGDLDRKRRRCRPRRANAIDGTGFTSRRYS